jgi:hypothetical protein
VPDEALTSLSLLSDLHRVAGQLSDANGREKSQIAEPETGTHQPASPPAASHSPDGNAVEEIGDRSERHGAGVVIGIDTERNSTTKLEQIEVTPEPDGRVSIMVRVKRVE